jgi:hypothetical protein
MNKLARYVDVIDEKIEKISYFLLNRNLMENKTNWNNPIVVRYGVRDEKE